MYLLSAPAQRSDFDRSPSLAAKRSPRWPPRPDLPDALNPSGSARESRDPAAIEIPSVQAAIAVSSIHPLSPPLSLACGLLLFLCSFFSFPSIRSVDRHVLLRVVLSLEAPQSN